MVDENRYSRNTEGREQGSRNRDKDPSQVMREFRVYRPDDNRYSTTRAVLWVAIVAGMAILLLTGVVKLTGGSRLSDWAVAEPFELEANSGELITFSAGRFEIQGGDPVKLVGASADPDTPAGLDVVDIRVGIDEGSGSLDQILGPVDPTVWTLRGVEGVILSPGTNDEFYLTVTLRAFEPGTYELPDIVVRYESDRNVQGALFEPTGQFTVR